MERCRGNFGKKGGTFPAKDLDPGPHSPSATCTSALPTVYAVVIKPISCQAYTSLSWFLFVFKASCLMHMVTTWVWIFSIMVNLLACFSSSCSLGTVFAAHRGGFWGSLSALWSCPPGQAPMSQGNAQFNQFHLFKWRLGSEIESCWELGSVHRGTLQGEEDTCEAWLFSPICVGFHGLPHLSKIFYPLPCLFSWL